MSTPVLFSNDEFELQLIPSDGDTFIVVASGVARHLAFRDATAMLRAVPEDEKGYTLVCTPGGDQRVSFLTEPGLYRVLGQRQAARIADERLRGMVDRFQRFLFHDLLPAFRRGEITLADRKPAIPPNYAAALREAADQYERAALAEAKVAELKTTTTEQGKELATNRPKAVLVDTFYDPKGDTTTIGTLAKQLGLREQVLRDYLVARKVIYRRVLGRRYSRSKGREAIEYQWLPRSGFEPWFTLRDHPEVDRLYNNQVATTLYVNPVGKARIAELMQRHPINPPEGGAA